MLSGAWVVGRRRNRREKCPKPLFGPPRAAGHLRGQRPLYFEPCQKVTSSPSERIQKHEYPHQFSRFGGCTSWPLFRRSKDRRLQINDHIEQDLDCCSAAPALDRRWCSQWFPPRQLVPSGILQNYGHNSVRFSTVRSMPSDCTRTI